jgi:hypothetical protein
MKLSKNISYFMLTLGVGAVSTSCLKDSANVTSPGAGSTNNVVEFMNSSVPVSYSAIWPQYDNGVTIVGDTGGFNMNVDYTGAQTAAPTDITVNIALDTAALTAFNNDQQTNYVLPPADVFSFPSSVVIKAGTEKTITRLTMTAAADYDYSQSYAIPLTITSSSYGIVSTNFGTAIYSFILNNQYTDNYVLTGYFFRAVSGSRSLNLNYYLSTTGVTTNSFPFGDLGTSASQYYFNLNTPSAGGAMTNYVATGATPAAPSSGLMSTDNPGNFGFPDVAPIAPGSGSWVSSTYNNTYDATNKIYWLHIGYGSGSTGVSGWSRQVYEKMVAQ